MSQAFKERKALTPDQIIRLTTLVSCDQHHET